MAFQQEIEFAFAANKIGQTPGVQCLEAALGSRDAVHCPRRDWLANTLDLVEAKVAQAEPIAEQQACRSGDDHRAWLG